MKKLLSLSSMMFLALGAFMVLGGGQAQATTVASFYAVDLTLDGQVTLDVTKVTLPSQSPTGTLEYTTTDPSSSSFQSSDWHNAGTSITVSVQPGHSQEIWIQDLGPSVPGVLLSSPSYSGSIYGNLYRSIQDSWQITFPDSGIPQYEVTTLTVSGSANDAVSPTSHIVPIPASALLLGSGLLGLSLVGFRRKLIS